MVYVKTKCSTEYHPNKRRCGHSSHSHAKKENDSEVKTKHKWRKIRDTAGKNSLMFFWEIPQCIFLFNCSFDLTTHLRVHFYYLSSWSFLVERSIVSLSRHTDEGRHSVKRSTRYMLTNPSRYLFIYCFILSLCANDITKEKSNNLCGGTVKAAAGQRAALHWRHCIKQDK